MKNQSGSAFGLLFVAGIMLVLAVSQAFRRGGLSEGLWYAAILASVLFAILFISAMFNLAMSLRNALVTRGRPEALSFTSPRTQSLSDAMEALSIAEQTSIAELPAYISLVIDHDAIEFWGGFIKLKRYCRFPWHVVGRVAEADLGRQGFRGVSVEVLSGSHITRLPLLLVGSGPGGLFSPSSARATLILERIERLRGAETGPTSES